MDKRLLLLIPCFATSSAATLKGEVDWTDYSFELHSRDFFQLYDPAEVEARRAIFNDNLVLINEHNSNPSKTWFASVNEFTAWTNAEFRKRRAHGTKSHQSTRDSGLTEEPAAYGSLPDSVDWRTKAGVMTPVKNQGDCGSCWAFSATETLESAVAIATKKPAPVLAPQQIVSCAPNPKQCGGSGGCSGSTQELAFQYTQSPGLTSESDYPYTQKTGTCQQSNIKPVAKNKGFVKLPVNNYTALAAAVANIGPIAISVAAGASGWQIYGGGVYGTGASDCGFDQDHAVQAVGYGTDGGKDYWLVRNSWGDSWGEEGYIRIRRFGEGKEPCGMDTTPSDGSACAGDKTPVHLCGVCGILGDSSYPTGAEIMGPSPSPTPPAPSPTPPSPGCSDSEDSPYCDYVKSNNDCSMLHANCQNTCGCCGAKQPSYCNGSEFSKEADAAARAASQTSEIVI